MTTDDEKPIARANLARRFDLIEATLGDGRPDLTGADYTIADIYLLCIRLPGASWRNGRKDCRKSMPSD